MIPGIDIIEKFDANKVWSPLYLMPTRDILI